MLTENDIKRICEDLMPFHKHFELEDLLSVARPAAKEAEESQYWLWLCDYAKNYPDCKPLILKLEEINKVLGKILFTAKSTKAADVK